MKLSPFPPGWCLGYLIRVEDEGLEVGFLSIVGMEVSDDGERIHAIVASPTGALVRDRDIEHPIICIVGPDEDRQRVGAAGAAEWCAKRQAKPAAIAEA